MRRVLLEADGARGFGSVDGDTVADLTTAFAGRAVGLCASGIGILRNPVVREEGR
ncbi:hypothetical protein [Muricoccus vinaceus]|uniref:Uncharacterized protein n=1 Tax=Muricoccus vinaceus TaxID=424704 RepID=A0ABV6IY03_9PROT